MAVLKTGRGLATPALRQPADWSALTRHPWRRGGAISCWRKSIGGLSAAGVVWLANLTATAQLTSLDVGSPQPSGATVSLINGWDMTGGGKDIGGTTDQFQFNYQMRTDNFDVQVRIASLSQADTWSKAGLLARETLDPGSRFAAVLATPTLANCFLESRLTAKANATLNGTYPVNYPNTWLRLQRVGNQYSGFASLDGTHWTLLGTANLQTNNIYLGLAVTSHNTNQTARAEFRDFGNVMGGVVGALRLPNERLGPCSRRTPLVISEIMYKPAARTDGLNTEFLELYNSNPWWEDMGGYQLAGAVQYTFPTHTMIPGGGFLVVAAVPADLRQAYGITNVVGPYAQSLKKSGTIRLLGGMGAVLLEISYSNTLPWPAGADGTGHSIVLARPSYGEGDPRAWSISSAPGGSPGGPEVYRGNPWQNVVINEFLAHPAGAAPSYVELYNHDAASVDISGCILTDHPKKNMFVIATNTVLGAGQHLAFDQNQLGFALNPAGGLLLFKAPDGERVLDAVTYEAQGLGVSSGRWPDGAEDIYPLAAQTPGAPNGDIQIGDIVINELMYKPISGDDDDQYLELFNQGATAADLSGWQFTAGPKFTFPSNTVLAAGGYLVVARNLANLLARYPNLNRGNAVGNFTGKLPHKGGRVALARPELVVTRDANGVLTTNVNYVVEDEVSYQAGGRWGPWAHGGGSSLELIHPKTNHRLADNWADSDETGKSSWVTLQSFGILDNGANYSGSRVDLLQVGLLDVGECLLDNVEVHPGTNAVNYVRNGDFEAGKTGWTMQGDHIRSSIETAGGLGGFQSAASLHIRSSDGLWTGANSVQGTLTNTTLAANQTATLRVTGRWLRGSPEVIMRLRGNWLELAGTLPIPPNLGTPGLPNSRALANPGPAIFDVSHSPPLPAASQPVVVTACFHNLGQAQPTLLYRLDSSTLTPTYRSVAMVDNGLGGDAVAGDGIFSATIPGQASGAVVDFVIKAQNDHGVITVFPRVLQDNTGVPRECVVRFGDLIPSGSFGHYHLWLTQNWINRWASLPALSNENNDATFVDGGGRIIYNMLGRFAGSPYHQYSGSPVTTLGGMHWTMPEDDRMLGNTSFNKQHVPGNGPLDDATLQREQTSYWMARQIGLPWGYRRYYALFVNGNRHGPLMEDSQVPGGDLLAEYFPYDNNGFLHKNNAWFEFDNNGQNFANQSWCTLNKYTTVLNGVRQHKLARYRWNYWIRQYPDSANNFTNVFALIDAANVPTTSAAYFPGLEAVLDTEEFLRMSAIEHATGDWDSFTTQNQWNMYSYKPLRGKWTLLKWDWNISLGNSGSWGPDGGNLFTIEGADTRMSSFLNYAPYLRAYLRALRDIANGPMNNTNVDPVLDAKYAAFAANGLNAAEPGANGLKNWIRTMHTSLLSAITSRGVANVAFAVNGPLAVTTGAGAIALTGTAPLEVKFIAINGIRYPTSWTSTKTWSLTIPLHQATNVWVIQGYDRLGNGLSNLTTTLTVVATNTLAAPPSAVWINEWLASNHHGLTDPADGQAEDWLELYNPNSNPLDVSGYTLTDQPNLPAAWTIPPGTLIPGHGYLLIWADGGLAATGPGAGNDLHASFNLSKVGGYIGLFAWDGHLVDSVTYGAQVEDVSEGRWPDGSTNLYAMPQTTPGAPNVMPPAALLRFTAQSLDSGGLLLQAQGPVGQAVTLQYSTDLANWTNLLQTNFNSVPLLLQDTNLGAPQRFYRLTVP